MTLSELKKALDQEFCPPFIQKDMVKTKWVGGKGSKLLEIKIGPRDIWLDEKGKVHAAGTDLK